MLEYLWPMALVILSNTVYQISAKSLPTDIHPLASITISYGIAAGISLILYFVISHGGNILREYQHANWTSFVIGLAVVGLEVGMLYAYRVGWPVSEASIVQAAILGIVLLIVGALLFHETLTPSKVIGIIICMVGLYFINK